MELEKIRAADTQVRWQDDEDVDECRSCKTNFTVTRRKVKLLHFEIGRFSIRFLIEWFCFQHHCRHCGSIYCEKCLTKTVVSGRGNKPARVCDVCHTLLVQNTAPYFRYCPNAPKVSSVDFHRLPFFCISAKLHPNHHTDSNCLKFIEDDFSYTLELYILK